jgi:hypothetical protein
VPQDARKGVLFDQLPPVLQLQLKRFEYDFVRDTMVKVRLRGGVCVCIHVVKRHVSAAQQVEEVFGMLTYA